MKRPQEKLRSFAKGNTASVKDVNSSHLQHDKNWHRPEKKWIAFYVLLSTGWFPSLSLGLLTTVLGTLGILPTAKADEVPEPPNLGLRKDEINHPLGREIAVAPQRNQELRGQEKHQSFSDSESLAAPHELAGRTPKVQDENFFSTSPASPDLSIATDSLQRESKGVSHSVETFLASPCTQSPSPQSANIDQTNFRFWMLDAGLEGTPVPELMRKDKPKSQILNAKLANSTPVDAKEQLEKPLPPTEGGDSLRSRVRAQVSGFSETQHLTTDAGGRSALQQATPQPLTKEQGNNPGEPSRRQGILAPTDDRNRVRIRPRSVTLTQNNAPTTDPAGLAPGTVRILTPQTGVTNNRSTNLVLQYNANDQIQISVNQKPLDPKTTTQQNRDETQNLINQAWYNIPLQEGENTITVQAGNGTPVSVQLLVKKTTVKLEIAPVGDPRVAADGRSTLTHSARITDENGQLLSEDTLVTLTTSAGQFVGADQDKDQPGFQVRARGGEFTAQLQSSIDAQKVQVRAAVDESEVGKLNAERSNQPSNLQTSNPQPSTLQPSTLQPSTPLEAYTQVEFITNLRPSLVSGVIDLRIGPSGTNFWGRRRDFLNPETINDGTQFDLQGAVFATGRVGEWLFTGAYNSAPNHNESCDGITRLFREQQFCEQQYPVTG